MILRQTFFAALLIAPAAQAQTMLQDSNGTARVTVLGSENKLDEAWRICQRHWSVQSGDRNGEPIYTWREGWKASCDETQRRIDARKKRQIEYERAQRAVEDLKDMERLQKLLKETE